MQPTNKRLVTEASVVGHVGAEVTTPGTPTAAALSATFGRNLTGVQAPIDWGKVWKPKRNGAKSTVAIVGDSIAQLYDASTYADSWAGKLTASLQAKYGDGGSGWIGVANSAKYANSGAGYGNNLMFPVVASAGWGFTSALTGPGLVGALSTVVGDVLTFKNVRGTSANIWAIRNTTNGDIEYRVNGGTYTTASTTGAAGIIKIPFTLPAGSHTVEVRVKVANTNGVAIFGLSAENATGVVVNNFSLQSKTSSAYVATGTYGFAPDWNGGVLYPSDLLIYTLGVNDSFGAAGAATTEDGYIDNIETLVNAVQNTGGSLGATDLCFFIPAIGSWQSTGPKYYKMMLRLAAYAISKGAAFIDFNAIQRNSRAYGLAVGYYGSGNATPGVAGTDNVHPSDAGMTQLFEAIDPLVAG